MTVSLVHYAVLEVPEISDSTALAGLFKGLSGLEVGYDVLEYREGGNNEFVHRLPGRLQYPNLVLSWGIVNNDLLLKWFMETHAAPKPKEMSLTLATASGADLSTGRKFTFTDAYPVRWTGPQLVSDRSDPESWGETLEIAHSGLKLT
jgi:phage tail-like protein